MKKTILNLFLLTALSCSLQASQMQSKVIDSSIEKTMTSLLDSLGKNNLKIVAEIDILAKMKHAGLVEKMGKNWNTQHLTGLKALIVCNGKIGMSIANVGPIYAGACPIKITLIEHNNTTTITYSKEGGDTKNEALESALKVLDETVAKAVNAVSN